MTNEALVFGLLMAALLHRFFFEIKIQKYKEIMVKTNTLQGAYPALIAAILFSEFLQLLAAMTLASGIFYEVLTFFQQLLRPPQVG